MSAGFNGFPYEMTALLFALKHSNAIPVFEECKTKYKKHITTPLTEPYFPLLPTA